MNGRLVRMSFKEGALVYSNHHDLLCIIHNSGYATITPLSAKKENDNGGNV